MMAPMALQYPHGERHDLFQGHQAEGAPNTQLLPCPLSAVLGSQDPCAAQRAVEQHLESAGPPSQGRPQQPSKMTAAQKAWNVFGLIFGIAVGNSPGQI